MPELGIAGLDAAAPDAAAESIPAARLDSRERRAYKRETRCGDSYGRSGFLLFGLCIGRDAWAALVYALLAWTPVFGRAGSWFWVLAWLGTDERLRGICWTPGFGWGGLALVMVWGLKLESLILAQNERWRQA